MLNTRRRDVLILGLIFVLGTCYLCFQHSKSRWLARKKQTNAIPVIFPDPFELHRPTRNEKFLSYLPHSGFHNQRIELENALLLASYLNRTLLVPPVFLSSPAMPWLRYEKLYERLLLQNKNGLDHCVSLEPDMPLPSECLNSFRWSNLPWTFFYNLTDLQVPMVFREGLDYEWLYSTFKLKSDDIYFFKDMSPYEYQIFDDENLDLPLDRFNYKIDIASLEQIEHRVLHFGSMFGSYRILAETEAHLELLRTIRSNMIFRHPVLLGAAQRVVDKLGGANSFVGMHVRVGDGIFKLRASILVDDIYHELADKFTDLTVEQVAQYEGGYDQHDQDRTESTEYEIKLRSFHPVDETNYTKPIEVHHTQPIIEEDPNIKLSCQPGDDVTNKFRHTVVYIATDAPDPRNHPLLRKLFNIFPCTFVLSDFADELEEVKKLQVVEERVKLESYLIPLLDAMISAHGHTFLGTPHSTFTSYIERQLHPVYTDKKVHVMGLEEYLSTQ